MSVLMLLWQPVLFTCFMLLLVIIVANKIIMMMMYKKLLKFINGGKANNDTYITAKIFVTASQGTYSIARRRIVLPEDI